MTAKLENIVAYLKTLPAAAQDELADKLASLVNAESDLRLTTKQEAEVREILSAPAEYATDDDLRAVFG